MERTSGPAAFAAIAARRSSLGSEVEAQVAATIADVARRGDAALLAAARSFDAPELKSLRVSEEELERATLPPGHHTAIQTALARVRRFHEAQLAVLLGNCSSFFPASPEPIAARWSLGPDAGQFGIGQMIRSIEAAGVYVPGGRATYPSSVIMNVIPAAVARVSRIAVTTPARADGTLAPAVLVALREAGVQEAYKIGGATAIAALALGTETIPRVDKIVGPGNRWVNEAKRQLWGRVGLDGYAGPSEVCVVADASAPPARVARDLLTQLEHAPDNLGFLITIGPATLGPILDEIESLILTSPRQTILREALDHSLSIEARYESEAIEFANAIACEHVSLAVADPDRLLLSLRHAGCILLGDSPESAGDFAAGPSHTLPTNGAARWQSPVNVMDFLRFQSVIRLSQEERQGLAPVVAAFGEMEGLPIHGVSGMEMA